MSAYSDLFTLDSACKIYYRFNEATNATTATDAKGNLNGTMVTGATSVAGAINDGNNALDFPGNTNAVITTDPGTGSILDVADGPFSVVIWAKRDTSDLGRNQTLATKGTGTWQLRFNTGNSIAFLKNGGSNIVTYGNFNDANWHLFVITKNAGTTMKLYVDGYEPAGLSYSNQTLSDTNTALRIGHFSAGNEQFNGSLDEFAYLNRVLSAAEVETIYQTGLGIVQIAIPAAPMSGAGVTMAADHSPAPPASSISGVAPPPSIQVSHSIGIPAASISGAGGSEGTALSPEPPAASASGAAPPPATTDAVGVPAAVISGVAIPIGTEDSDSFSIPAPGVSGVAVPPSIELSHSFAVPAAAVAGAGGSDAVTLEAAPPAAVIDGVAVPPAGVVGTFVAIPAAVINALAPPPGTEEVVNINIPAAVINAVGLAPGTQLTLGLPSASVAGDAGSNATSDAAGIPASPVSGVAATPSAALDAGIPASVVNAVSPPPEAFNGIVETIPAAAINAVAPPPATALDISALIPAAAINAVAVAPVVNVPGVGDSGGGGGMGGPRRGRAKRVPPQEVKNVSVNVPAARTMIAAAVPNYLLNQPDEDLIIMLLYGPQT